MADGILGLGSSGSVNLSNELLEKLRTADEKVSIDPLTEDITDVENEISATDEIHQKLLQLLDNVKLFDLYETNNNVFDSVSATTVGTSADFDATDTSNLSPGTIAVTVNTLAQKTVYQSGIISDKTVTVPTGTLNIQVGTGTPIQIDTSNNGDGMTYEELVTQLNFKTGIDAGLEEVSDGEYRIVIKSEESGLKNALTITDNDGVLTGNNNEAVSKVQSAQNFTGKIDNIDYDVSSNQVTLSNGLIITAKEIGDSSITLSRDTSNVIIAVQNVATLYNELKELVDKYTVYDPESTTDDEDDNSDDENNQVILSDSSTIEGILSTVKNTFFKNYGLQDEENAFLYGISFNKNGEMEVDTNELGAALNTNFEDLKELFTGYAEKEGIGTVLTKYIDDLDGFEGILTNYQDRLDDKLSKLKTEKEEETNTLDLKYSAMAQRFAEYTASITSMENSFASFKRIIDGDDNDD